MATSKEEGSAMVTWKVIALGFAGLAASLGGWALTGVSDNKTRITALEAGSRSDDINRRLGSLETKVDALATAVGEKASSAKVDELIGLVTQIRVSVATLEAKAGG